MDKPRHVWCVCGLVVTHNDLFLSLEKPESNLPIKTFDLSHTDAGTCNAASPNEVEGKCATTNNR